MNWTAYQTLLIFLWISVMPVSFASANRVNQSNLFGRNVDKAESSLSYFPWSHRVCLHVTPCEAKYYTCDFVKGWTKHRTKTCPLESNKSLHFSCRIQVVTKRNSAREMAIMTPAPTHCWIRSKVICPRKFQNVWKNQLPFGQNVRNWFWSSLITDMGPVIILSAISGCLPCPRQSSMMSSIMSALPTNTF